MNDKELGDMVTRAQTILAEVRGNTPKDQAEVIRDSETLRETTAKAFAELKSSVDAAIINKPSRKFELED